MKKPLLPTRYSLLPLLLSLCLCASVAFAQTPISTDRLITNEIQVVTPALVAVSSVNAQVIGNGGSATYYYWIVAKFAAGNATPSNYALVISAPNTLSASNRVRVTWGAVAGATGYDVLRTTAAQLPNGAANIGRSLNQATTSVDDTGGALVSYSVATLQPRQLALQFVSPYWDALGQVAPSVSGSNHGRIYYDLTLNQWMASANGGAYSPFAGGAGAGILALSDGISSVSTPTVTFLTGTVGVDLNVVAGINDMTWNTPDASCAARGVLNTGAQILCGNKTLQGNTLVDGDLYATGNFSTDHPIEVTGETCVISEANVGLFGFDPTTGLPCYSYDGGTPQTVGSSASRFTSTGTPLVAGDFVPSAGWGASGSVAVTSTSTDQAFHITVTAAGAGQGLNPTVAFTFHDGTWTTVPIYVCTMETGGTGALSFFTPDNTSATVLTLTYAGTPVVNLTYKIACNGWGQ